MDEHVVFGAFRADSVHLCRGRVELTKRASADYLPVDGAYASLCDAKRAVAAMSVPHIVLAVRMRLPAGACFEVLQGSVGDRGGRRSVALLTSFTEALKVAEGRGFMGVGQCRIDMVDGPVVFASAAEFHAAGRTPRGVPLLSWQGLNGAFFVLDEAASAERRTPAAIVGA